jgi:hypothetical protein
MSAPRYTDPFAQHTRDSIAAMYAAADATFDKPLVCYALRDAAGSDRQASARKYLRECAEAIAAYRAARRASETEV